jgi:hypothetical protein
MQGISIHNPNNFFFIVSETWMKGGKNKITWNYNLQGFR